MTKRKFEDGDLVTKLHGKRVMEVLGMYDENSYYGWRYRLQYLTGGKSTTYEYERNLKLHEPKETTMANTLYTFEENGTTIYATVIGKTEGGMLVLEAKGGVGIFTKPETEVKEVIPYTIDISFDGAKVISYESTKGVLSKGDVVINETGNFGVVKGVDTKSKTARPNFKGRRVVTEKIA